MEAEEKRWRAEEERRLEAERVEREEQARRAEAERIRMMRTLDAAAAVVERAMGKEAEEREREQQRRAARHEAEQWRTQTLRASGSGKYHFFRYVHAILTIR